MAEHVCMYKLTRAIGLSQTVPLLLCPEIGELGVQARAEILGLLKRVFGVSHEAVARSVEPLEIIHEGSGLH